MATFTSEASYVLQRWERALREGQSSLQDSWNAGQHGSLAVSNPSRGLFQSVGYMAGMKAAFYHGV